MEIVKINTKKVEEQEKLLTWWNQIKKNAMVRGSVPFLTEGEILELKNKLVLLYKNES